ncbi:Protein kinase family protein [Euphorbia peplus]|nr:Protein kinase family protein [Euphorbia peplus]
MKSSIRILCLLVLNLTGQNLGCEETSCGVGGPSIRFPFRLKNTQPDHCGYPNPGFDLSCTENNHTLIQLPNSVQVYVKAIDYVNQIMNISHPHNCFQSQARDISLYAGGSPFQFYEQFPSDFTLFNCSGPIVPDAPTPEPIACLAHPPYQVYAVENLGRLSDNTWLVSCTKMYNVLSVPYRIFSPEQTNNLQLTWSQPACGTCEAKGGTCSQFNTCAYLPHSTKAISIKLVITGVTSFIVVLVLVVAAFVIHTSQREKEKQARIEKFLQDYEALTLTRYSYSDLKRITNRFQVKLGEGAFGQVFKGKISNEILVAVKILKNSIGNGDEFTNEVGTLGTIHHVNVVRLVGFCAEGYHRAFIYEFLPNESLDKFIFSNDRNSLTWKKLQHIALGIAKGIQYLHQGCDQRILHFDIKPHNILLDENFTPKIADFGLSKLCSKDQSVVSMTNARGTMGYIAPEVFSRNFGNVSYKSDIYSYGMLLLEIVGGRKSIEEKSSQASFPEWIYDHLKRGEELQIRTGEQGDAQIVRKLTIVGLWCIQWFPVDRPSMTIVLQMLEGEGNDLEMPPNPFTSNALRNMDATNIPRARRTYQDLEVISEIE